MNPTRRDPFEIAMLCTCVVLITLVPHTRLAFVSRTISLSQDSYKGTYLLLPVGTFPVYIDKVVTVRRITLPSVANGLDIPYRLP